MLFATQASSATQTSPLWESGLVAAVIAAVVGLVGYWMTARASRLDRQRQLFGEAFGAVMEYREYPFIVRRRASDSDREGITTGLSTIQASLNKHVALLRVESDEVGVHYENLVAETRRIAGAAIAEGWEMSVRQRSDEMHVRDVDLSPLVEFDEAFVAAVKRHLRVVPLWVPGRKQKPVNSQQGNSAAKSGRPAGS